MAASIRQIFINEVITGATGGANQTSGRTYDSALLQDFAYAVSIDEGTNGSTLDVKLQDSPDGGTTWFDYLSFTQASADTTEAKAAPSRHPLGLMRVVYT